MQDSMYSALFGALTNEHRLDIIANNLANANTTGYKQDRLAFKDVMVRFAHDTIMEPIGYLRAPRLLPEPTVIAKPRLSMTRTDFSQGSLHETGNPLDLSIMGEGFFKVRTENGDFLTRNGNFRRTADGILVNGDGYPVLGGGGEITLPQGEVVVGPSGVISVDGNEVATLDVVAMDTPDSLDKLGNNLYRLREGSQATEVPAPDFTVEQGYLEASNINVVEEMVNMIETQRAYEAYGKVIKATDETDEKVITRVGRTS